MKFLWFEFLRKLTTIIAKIITPIHSPYSHKYIKYDHVMRAMTYLKSGDIILTRTHGDLSTVVIPGFWKHAAIYAGDGKIIDATSVGVTERHLADLMMTTDNVAVLRVANVVEDLSKGQLMVDYARLQIGKKYDLEMRVNRTDAMFCSELVYHAICHVFGKDYIELRERMGIKTLTPDDCYKAHGKFTVFLKIIKD